MNTKCACMHINSPAGWVRVVCMFVAVFMLGGCADATRVACTGGPTPYELADTYLEYLTPYEQQGFIQSIRDEGFQKTMASVPYPGTVWGVRTTGGSRVVTPKGRMTYQQYEQFCDEAERVTDALRSHACPKKASALGADH